MLMHAEAPENAAFLGDVTISWYEPHSTIASVQNALRNTAAKLGANLVVIDVITTITGDDGGYSFTGSGRAYRIKNE